MSINTHHLSQSIKTLELSIEKLKEVEIDTIEYEVFRNATIKGFELTLETAGKLLRKALKGYMSSSREVDELTYKNLFRYANKHGLLDSKTVERWYLYRDNRNNTAHDYGIAFVKTTLKLMPNFLKDAKDLEKLLTEKFGS